MTDGEKVLFNGLEAIHFISYFDSPYDIQKTFLVLVKSLLSVGRYVRLSSLGGSRRVPQRTRCCKGIASSLNAPVSDLC